MSNLSSYAAQIITDWMTGKSDPPEVTTRYLALFDDDPEVLGEEITDIISSVGRQEITSSMDAADLDGLSENQTEIDFGTAIANGSIAYLAIFDSLSGGNLIASAALTDGTQEVVEGDALTIIAEGFKVTSS